MRYQRQNETIYNHYLFETETGELLFLIGVNKDIPEEEAKLLVSSPLLNYPENLWGSFFCLNQSNRKIIMDVLNEVGTPNGQDHKNATFNNYYWKVLVDFLFFRFNVTLYDIARELEGTGTRDKNAEKKTTYDRLDKLRHAKGLPRKETLKLVKEICAYYLITDDILENGHGVMYSLSPEIYTEEFAKEVHSKYTMDAIRKIGVGGRPLKELIMEITGLKESEICEARIQIACKKNTLSAENQKLIETFMEKLKQD